MLISRLDSSRVEETIRLHSDSRESLWKSRPEQRRRAHDGFVAPRGQWPEGVFHFPSWNLVSGKTGDSSLSLGNKENKGAGRRGARRRRAATRTHERARFIGLFAAISEALSSGLSTPRTRYRAYMLVNKCRAHVEINFGLRHVVVRSRAYRHR